MKKILVLLIVVSFQEALAQVDLFKTIDSLLLVPDYDGAITIIDQHHKTINTTLSIQLRNKQAEVLILQGKLSAAAEILNGITRQEDTFLQAITLSNIGFLKINQARLDQAKEALEESLQLFQGSKKLNTKEGATCLANLALFYNTSGKYNQAKENELQALSIRQQLFGEESEAVAASLNDLGLIYSQIDTDIALEYYDRALSIYERIYGKNHPKIAVAKTNIGLIYHEQELYGDAINTYEEARAIWEKIYPNGHPNVAQINMQLGNTYKRMKNISGALAFYEKALAIYRKAYGDKHPDIAQALNQIGIIKLDQQKYDDALALFHQAVVANAPRFNSQDQNDHPEITDFYNAKVMLYSIHFKAQTLEARHYGKTLKLADLQSALDNLLVCDSIIDDIRHHSTDESDKLALGESANEVYDDGVKIAEAMSLITINAAKYKALAFYFAEKSKSAVLMESIADTQAKSFAGIPDELVAQEKDLRSEITLLTQKLSQKPTIDEEKLLRFSLFEANQRYLAFTKKLEKDYPNYFNLKFNTTTASIEEVQKVLDNQTALISYFVSERNSRLYEFIITNKTVELKNLTLPQNFDRLIRGFNNSLFYSDIDTYRKAATSLSKLLLPKINKEKLILLPSGRLGTIPFEALFIKKRFENFEDVTYAISKHAIRYEFSAGLLLQKAKAEENTNTESIFLCAPIQFNQRANLGDLPGTELEVNAISKMFEGNATAVKFSEATETAIKSNSIEKYNYLHFATHGIVDESNPELSRIFLNTSFNEDGDLYSGEIYNLKLNADLAVLSACQTGLGKYSKGEGVIGLSRALTYAGARNIVVSFWSVSDESTAQLMTEFYQDVLKKSIKDFSVSLRQSKLKLIQEKKYSSPYFWAPFVLIGN